MFRTIFYFRDRSPSFRIITRIFYLVFEDLKSDDFYLLEGNLIQEKIRENQIQRIKFLICPPEICSITFPSDSNEKNKQEAYIATNYIFIGIEMTLFIPFFTIVLFLGEFEYFPILKTQKWLFTLAVFANFGYLFSIYFFSIFFLLKGNKKLRKEIRR